jgi:hypothetical protein
VVSVTILFNFPQKFVSVALNKALDCIEGKLFKLNSYCFFLMVSWCFFKDSIFQKRMSPASLDHDTSIFIDGQINFRTLLLFIKRERGTDQIFDASAVLTLMKARKRTKTPTTSLCHGISHKHL